MQQNPMETVSSQAVDLYDILCRARDDGVPKYALVDSLGVSTGTLYALTKTLTSRGWMYCPFFSLYNS